MSTPKPTTVLRKGRYDGGIYLLATAAARGRICGLPTVTTNSITLDVDGTRVSGLYLQPSLSAEEVKAEL